ncbi:single-stranded DNA-binding protein [Bacillus alveayuensis]|uniref:Single-stranded DNA-binding protein n=1 Tax=Aeribacillus alveayuensis TaxID=279215 RepID=A0ABT9VNM2_9BACI|nr:single-stranded DNA-binding protein [Bacillus alveayuensis]MDQ0162582.1 single-strand DNA-binding protein [Bacillus alveayuensis]
MINQVTLVGRLTRDPEIRYTSEGAAVANITLAVSRKYRNSAGEIDADFVNCTLWRRTAENTANYCRKGSIVGVTGRIQTRNYENNEGKRVYVTEVVADSVQFMGTPPPQVRTRELAVQETNE